MRQPISSRIVRTLSTSALALTLSLLAFSGHTIARAQEAALDAQQAVAGGQAPPPATPAPTPAAERRAAGQNVNVRIDITITDQSGTNTPVTKTLNVIAADREGGSIRSKVEIPIARLTSPQLEGFAQSKNFTYVTLPLNIDIRPELVEGGRIKARLILNYQTATPPKTTTGEPHATSEVTANVIALLENGKPLIVSQSADAASDRKVTVELKATILK